MIAALAEALHLIDRGLRVAAFAHDGSPGRFFARDRDEHGNLVPGSGWKKKSTSDADTVRMWFEKEPSSQLRVPLGLNFRPFAYAGLMLDADRPGGRHNVDADGIASVKQLQADYGPLPKSRLHRTPGGGYHLLLAGPLDNPIGSRPGGLARYPGVHVIGEGGISPWPPSVRPDGTYSVVRNLPLDAVEAAPGWLVDLLRERPRRDGSSFSDIGKAGSGDPEDPLVAAYLRATIIQELNKLSEAEEGRRNTTLNEVSFVLGTIAWAIPRADLVYDRLREIGEALGLEEYEVGHTRDSGWHAGQREPRNLSAVGHFPDELATKLWTHGLPISGTAAETYLTTVAPGLSTYPACLRFKPTYGRHPAALMVRVALDENGDTVAAVHLKHPDGTDQPLVTIGGPRPLPVMLRFHDELLVVTTRLDEALRALVAAPAAGVVFTPCLHRLEYRLPTTVKRVLLIADHDAALEALELALRARGVAVCLQTTKETRRIAHYGR